MAFELEFTDEAQQVEAAAKGKRLIQAAWDGPSIMILTFEDGTKLRFSASCEDVGVEVEPG